MFPSVSSCFEFFFLFFLFFCIHTKMFQNLPNMFKYTWINVSDIFDQFLIDFFSEKNV